MYDEIDHGMVTSQAPLNVLNTTAVDHYLLVVTVNESSSFNTTVPANTTSVNIFETFPNISRRRYTLYSLHVAAVDSAGLSYFTNIVSMGMYARLLYDIIWIII